MQFIHCAGQDVAFTGRMFEARIISMPCMGWACPALLTDPGVKCCVQAAVVVNVLQMRTGLYDAQPDCQH